MGRPLKDIDPVQVRKLAMLGCSNREIAKLVGCDEGTIRNRFSAEVELGEARGKMRIRYRQFKRAMDGSDTMLIHLGKNRLGQSDKYDHTSDGKPLPGGPNFVIHPNGRGPSNGDIPRVSASTETAGIPE